MLFERKRFFLYLLLVAMMIQIINIGEVLADGEGEILETSKDIYKEDSLDVEDMEDFLHNNRTEEENILEKTSEELVDEDNLDKDKKVLEIEDEELDDVDMEIKLCEGNKILDIEDIEVKGMSLDLNDLDKDESLAEAKESHESNNHNEGQEKTNSQVKDILPNTGIKENTIFLGFLSLLGGLYLQKKDRRI